MEDLPIVAAGRDVPDALDRIRRYCGLAWSGGQPETWAWHYYDAVHTEQDDVVTATDVVCAAALHPGLARRDLAFFRERPDELSAWLAKVPGEVRLWEISTSDLEHLASLADRFPEMAISLLSKVLHRKRPLLIPLLDRHVIDWYRPLTGKRAMPDAWAPIVKAMRDEELDPERRLLYSIAFTGIEQELWPEAAVDDRPRLSWIRAVDIAIWMGTR
jgi:hypothetical protein